MKIIMAEYYLLQITFIDGEQRFYNRQNRNLVKNPIDATKYEPLNKKYPEIQTNRELDFTTVAFMEAVFYAEIEFVRYSQALKFWNYKNK